MVVVGGVVILSQADDIRSFVLKTLVEPARANAEVEITIRAGDIHDAMKLSNAYPSVCSALGSTVFSSLAKVRLIEQTGPAQGANTFFRFALDSERALTLEEARVELQRRYGQPIQARGNYVTAFALNDGRQLALEEQGASVRIWMEGVSNAAPPASIEVSFYEPSQGRNSNLPSRLSHNPPTALRAEGFPRAVMRASIQTPMALSGALDWYERAGGMRLDRRALDTLEQRFLERYPDFPSQTFANSAGGYWDEERKYKQTMLDRVAQHLRAAPPLSEIELGRQLLAALIEKPSNLLNWRTLERLGQIRKSRPDVIEKAAAVLARSAEGPARAVAQFVSTVWPLFSDGNEDNQPYSDVRNISSMLLALAKPLDAMAARYQRLHNAAMALIHRPVLRNQPLSEEEYRDVLSLAQQVFEVMRDEWKWAPRDLWDVQGFIWATCGDKVDSDSGEDESAEMANNEGTAEPPTNLILYGPPGTGKTYVTAQKAVELCDGVPATGDRSELMKRYKELVARKRIEFVTFHQSYSYEDFIEGLRPETGNAEGDASESGAGFKLVPRPGIFQSIADRAASNRGPSVTAPFKIEGRQAFKMSIGQSSDDEKAYLFDEAIEKERVMLGYGGEVDWSDPKYEKFDAIKARWKQIDPNATGNDPNVQQLFALRSWMKVGDLVVISDGNRRFRAIGEITGDYTYAPRDRDDYHHQRSVKWLWINRDGLPREEIYSKNLSQVSIYQLNSDHLNWPALAQIISAGNAKAPSGVPEPYVLVIDEINRANISKVFGEMITLIEPDKRLGMQNEITLTLPYSGRSFGVPANLHIVGTMNTADRSIALLDTALRRRFQFQELMPDSELLSENIDGVNLRAALRGVNARIEYLFDRDHQIGHGFFMSCQSRADIEAVMRDKVIPLLVEYFYENWEKVRAVLNESLNDGAFVSRKLLSAPNNSSEEWAGNGERYHYSVNALFPPNGFQQLA